MTDDERRLREPLAKSAGGCTDALPAVTYDHHCILSFMGEDWRIAVACGTLVKLRNARGETIVDVAKMDWPTYQAAALAWDESPDGHLGALQEVPRKPASHPRLTDQGRAVLAALLETTSSSDGSLGPRPGLGAVHPGVMSGAAIPASRDPTRASETIPGAAIGAVPRRT
jgi:hypothetical protein